MGLYVVESICKKIHLETSTLSVGAANIGLGCMCALSNIIEIFVVYYVFMDVWRPNVKCEKP